jgi:hypothetical protein
MVVSTTPRLLVTNVNTGLAGKTQKLSATNLADNVEVSGRPHLDTIKDK